MKAHTFKLFGLPVLALKDEGDYVDGILRDAEAIRLNGLMSYILTLDRPEGAARLFVPQRVLDRLKASSTNKQVRVSLGAPIERRVAGKLRGIRNFDVIVLGGEGS